MPQVIEPSGSLMSPKLTTDHALIADGYRLPLRVWSPASGGSAEGILSGVERDAPIVVIGLHGFNDYSQAFSPLAESLARSGIRTYAVDQRGFGAATPRGRWHGQERLVEDLRIVTDLLRARHPEARLVLIGESMGGAVVLAALADGPLPVDGVILIAPAVWSRDTMPWYQRLALDAMAHVAPGLRVTARGIKVYPSDNIEMLRAMSADPLVVRETRVDALWGVTNLMDLAVDGISRLSPADHPTLILYGERDQIIPRQAFCRMLEQLSRSDPRLRLILYHDGWHMLPRDLQGGRVHEDIIAWVNDPSAPLPSGEETAPGAARMRDFCQDGRRGR